MSNKQESKGITKEEFRKLYHAIMQKDNWYERFLEQLRESDETFVRKALDGVSEEEKERYFEEFPEYKKYR